MGSSDVTTEPEDVNVAVEVAIIDVNAAEDVLEGSWPPEVVAVTGAVCNPLPLLLESETARDDLMVVPEVGMLGVWLVKAGPLGKDEEVFVKDDSDKDSEGSELPPRPGVDVRDNLLLAVIPEGLDVENESFDGNLPVAATETCVRLANEE